MVSTTGPDAGQERWLNLELGDGRLLEVVISGHGDGKPLVFHTGSPMAAMPFGSLAAAAGRHGSSLVRWSRPGYGASTPQPGRSIADAAADTAAILDAIEAETFVTIGWSAGGPCALACAGLLEDRCQAAVSLAGLAPYGVSGLDWLAGMGPENVMGFNAAIEGEGPLTELLEAVAPAFSRVQPHDVAEMFGGIVSEPDKAALHGELGAFAAAAIRGALSRGIAGWRDDILAEVGDWGFDPAAITTPVAVWHGGQDRMAPVDHGRWLAAHIPGAIAHIDPDQGHLSPGQIDQTVDDVFALSRSSTPIAGPVSNPSKPTRDGPAV